MNLSLVESYREEYSLKIRPFSITQTTCYSFYMFIVLFFYIFIASTNLSSHKLYSILIILKQVFYLSQNLFLNHQQTIIYCMYNLIMTQTQSRLARNLFKTNKKSPSIYNEYTDCHYCLIKQKFSGPDQKCLQHTITDNKSEISANQLMQDQIIQHILQLLLEVEDSLQEYWNNLHDYSQGNSQKVKEQLISVNQAVKRIEEKLSKFPFQQNKTFQQLEFKRFHHDQEQKKMGTRSQKFITSNFSQLFDDISTNDTVKQWVIYFHKIIVNKQIQQQILPLQEEIDMRIFKESMERKFVAFARNYDRYQRRTTQALQRLLFYMQNFGSELNGDMLSKDLMFIEQNEQTFKPPESEEFHRCILIQALTIQHLLAQKQLDVQYSQVSHYNT